MRKQQTTRKISSKTKKKSSSLLKIFLIFGFIASLLFAIYHYRNAILYYFSFKTSKTVKVDKIARARNIQVLSNHKDKVFGIDVSEYQGEIDWDEADSIENFKIGFVFVRATCGIDKVDFNFKENWKQLRSKKIIRGAYHYYRPNENSIAQAKFFVKAVKLSKGDLPPVLDIEQLPENQSVDSLKVGLRRWLNYVDAHYKVKPIIYTGESYYKDFLKDEFSEYTFWVANYNFWVENIKDDWLFWQFSEKGIVNGINENVDINMYNGSPKMLQYLTIYQTLK
jgi:lysozyme